MAGGSRGKLVIDLRDFDPGHRRALVFSILDKLVEFGAKEQVVLISDHDPSGLGYQIDLRKETRGVFEFTCDLRSDGAWVALLRRRQD